MLGALLAVLVEVVVLVDEVVQVVRVVLVAVRVRAGCARVSCDKLESGSSSGSSERCVYGLATLGTP